MKNELPRARTLIMTVLMVVIVGILLFFYWEDILAELQNWIANFPTHHYTGTIIFALGMGGLIYWIIVARKGWATVPLMTFWFVITFVILFLGLFAVTSAGLEAHTILVESFSEAFNRGDLVGAVKPLVTVLLVPLAFVFFAMGGFAYIASLVAPLEPTGALEGIAGAAASKHKKQRRKKLKHSDKRMKQKLGR